MGRYISGDWDYKFAVARQSSSFGEVFEDICFNTEYCSCSRFIGTNGQGEYVELYIENADDLLNRCEDFIGKDFVEEEDIEQNQEYWDKYMIKRFIDEVNLEKNEGETLNFYVEY